MPVAAHQFVLGVAHDDATGFARVRVAGRGTCKEASTLAIVLKALTETGPWRRVRFDLTGCTHMDSSFAGKLAGFARQVRGLPLPPRLEMTGASESLQDTLDSLLVWRLFAPEAAPEPLGLHEKLIELIPASRLEMITNCHEAHLELIGLGEENARRFGGVVEVTAAEKARLEAEAAAARTAA